MGVGSESLLSDSDADEESEDVSEESETDNLSQRVRTSCPSIRTYLQFWLCASSVSWACLLALVSLLQASCCFVIGIRKMSNRKNGQACQERFVSALKDRVTLEILPSLALKVMDVSSLFNLKQVITATIDLWMPLDASVFGSNIEVPVDHTIVTISLLEPFICLCEVAAVKLKVWSDHISVA